MSKGGKLRFKGDPEPNKRKKKKSKHTASSAVIGSSSSSKKKNMHDVCASTCYGDGPLPTNSSTGIGRLATEVPANPSLINQRQDSNAAAAAAAVVVQKGDGRITSSGTVLYGHDTNFMSQLNAGDAIVVNVDMCDGTGTTREEMRVITMRLSDVSASISSAFSNDLKVPTKFQFITKPRDIRKERLQHESKEKQNQEEIERTSFGTYATRGGRDFVYRERTEHGSYRIRKEIIKEDATRSDLLDMRTQKKSDKYC